MERKNQFSQFYKSKKIQKSPKQTKKKKESGKLSLPGMAHYKTTPVWALV